MKSRHRRSPIEQYKATDPTVDRLILSIRRLAAHRGYNREALLSPMLKRLMPTRKLSGDVATDTAELRQRLAAAGLDPKALAYLQESAEVELDFARLRLT